MDRGHANLIAEHIRKLEEQLGALQNKKLTDEEIDKALADRLERFSAVRSFLCRVLIVYKNDYGLPATKTLIGLTGYNRVPDIPNKKLYESTDKILNFIKKLSSSGISDELEYEAKSDPRRLPADKNEQLAAMQELTDTRQEMELEQCCQETDEEQALLEAGYYTREELFGVGGVKTCPKCHNYKMGKRNGAN